MVGRSNSLGKIKISSHATVTSKSFINNANEWFVFFGCYSFALILPFMGMKSNFQRIESFKNKSS